MTLKNNRAPLLSNIKLCASFHHHIWIQTGVTVRKRLSWVLTSVTLTIDLWPWPFAWTSLLSLVITPENFMMIQWWAHSQKGVRDGHLSVWTNHAAIKSGRVRRADRQTDRRTDWTIHRAAWSRLKCSQTRPPESYFYKYIFINEAVEYQPRVLRPDTIEYLNLMHFSRWWDCTTY